MPLFNISNKKLKPIKEENIDLERDIQELTENNLEEIFGLQFITTEFQLNSLRVDTLAFDSETNSFVIIEYKRDRSFSVVDQGFAYLSLLVNSKADFILEYNEKTDDSLRKGDVDWSQSRVIFVAGSFSTHQQKAIEFKDLPIELWEIELYQNKTILYKQLRAPESSESINTVTKSRQVKEVSKQVKKYTVDDHFKEGWDKSRKLFDKLREKILELDDRIEENPVKTYIGYRIGNDNLVSIHTNKTKLVVAFPRTQPKDLNDPNAKVYYWKNSYKYYNQHISKFDINEEKDIDYAMPLINQVYTKYFN
jgi:predicted transport protein